MEPSTLLSRTAALICAGILAAASGGCAGAKTPEPVDTEPEPPAPASATETRDDAPDALPDEEQIGDLETVALFDEMMPTGVTVSREGRVFVNFPRWGDQVPFTVAEIVDGEPKPFPNEQVNQLAKPHEEHFVSVQSVVVGPDNNLWALDTGRPQFGPPLEGGQKLVEIDLETNEVTRTIMLAGKGALETTYLNDVRFDMRRGEGGMAFITDSSGGGPNAIVVVDLASGDSWRKLNGHPATTAEEDFLPIVEGQPLKRRPEGQPASHMTVGADGIALSEDGERLYFRPLSGRGLFSVSVDALADKATSDEQVAETLRDYGDLGFASDGIIHDTDGNLYLTNYEDNGVVRRSAAGEFETVVHDPRALWPDTLAIGHDGYLYFTANQLHRQPSFHNGNDLREKPYVLFRVDLGAKPVWLK